MYWRVSYLTALALLTVLCPAGLLAQDGSQSVVMQFEDVEIPGYLAWLSRLTGARFIYDDTLEGSSGTHICP